MPLTTNCQPVQRNTLFGTVYTHTHTHIKLIDHVKIFSKAYTQIVLKVRSSFHFYYHILEPVHPHSIVKHFPPFLKFNSLGTSVYILIMMDQFLHQSDSRPLDNNKFTVVALSGPIIAWHEGGGIFCFMTIKDDFTLPIKSK